MATLRRNMSAILVDCHWDMHAEGKVVNNKIAEIDAIKKVNSGWLNKNSNSSYLWVRG